MSYQYESQRRRQGYGASGPRSAFGYWMPLVLTVTVATVGLAAWIWSERRDDDDDEDDRDQRHDSGPPPVYGDAGPRQTAYASEAQGRQQEDASVIARMSGALRRTPSPQQMLDGASRRVAAGVAAAGAVVGGALSSIREEDKKDFEDHSRWSEEAESRTGNNIAQGSSRLNSTMDQLPRENLPAQRPDDRRKAVAIVVSAETKHHGNHEEEVAYIQEHAVCAGVVTSLQSVADIYAVYLITLTGAHRC